MAAVETSSASADEMPRGEILRRGLRLVGRYIRGQPGPFAVSVLGAAVFAVAAVGTTVVLGRITDEVLIPAFEEGVTAETVRGGVLALLGVTLLRAISIVLRRYFGAMTGRRTQARLRRRIADRYLDVPLSFHQARPTGQLLAHADADVEAATEVIYPLPFSIGVAVLIVFSVMSLALVDPVLTAVALVLFPALAVLNRIYTSRVEDPASRVQQDVGRVSSVAHESIDGALVVKTLGREEAEVRRLAVEADRLRHSRIDVGRLRAAFEPAIDALPNVGIVVLLAVGAWQISMDRITTGDLVQAMALFGILAFPMRVVGFFLEEIPRSVVSIDRIDRVLAAPATRHPSPDEQVGLAAGPLRVEVTDVSFAYPDGPPVLDGLSFVLEPGEIVALVGSTGAGKSTVAHLLADLVPPRAGSVELSGVDLRRIDPEQVRSTVAKVFQESFLFADTILENITVGADVDRDRVRAAARVARADGFIRRLPEGYDTRVGERGVTLSGGQRQRVALARALVRGPRLLILDDATSAVDPTVEAEILRGLRGALDTTTLIVAHRVSTIRLADRVLFLSGGRIAAAGAHDELLADPAYEAIVTAYERAG